LLNQKKKYQQALWQVSDDILNLENPTDKDCEAADKRLVEAARVVLDFHWRKIKAEILGDQPLKWASLTFDDRQLSRPRGLCKLLCTVFRVHSSPRRGGR
jgi:hypothetical protein